MRENQRRSLRNGAKFLILAAATAFSVSLLMKNRLPDNSLIIESCGKEPAQTDANLPGPFDVARKGVTYTVTPVFNYDLWGMIVSDHSASSFLDISHKRWNDYLNTKDICVVWGKNVESGVYKNMKFHNRDFTCFYYYPDQETGRLFDENCLSNNHLLPADSIVGGKIQSARKGDQIHLKGWLVSYGIKDTPFRRMTSTTRSDRGNGACETIFVTDFEIARKANGDWQMMNRISLGLMVVCLAALFLL